MYPTFSFIEQDNTEQLFSNLKFAIEEIKLVRKISDLEDLELQLKPTIPPSQARFIRRKIDIARARLELIRLKAEKRIRFPTLPLESG